MAADWPSVARWETPSDAHAGAGSLRPQLRRPDSSTNLPTHDAARHGSGGESRDQPGLSKTLPSISSWNVPPTSLPFPGREPQSRSPHQGVSPGRQTISSESYQDGKRRRLDADYESSARHDLSHSREFASASPSHYQSDSRGNQFSRPPKYEQDGDSPPAPTGRGYQRRCHILQDIASEMTLLDSRIHTLLHGSTDHREECPQVSDLGPTQVLTWTLDVLRLANSNVLDLPMKSTAKETGSLPLGHDCGKEIRSQPPNEAWPTSSSEQQTPSHISQRSPATSDHPGLEVSIPGDKYHRPHHDRTTQPHSPRRRAESFGSSMNAPQSPDQQTSVRMLPSPSSMNFPNFPPTPSLPPLASQNKAQNTHLQELQHQVSVKTLAHQTMQKEYDSLIQKLERQRTKCATLEKKFEVSDVEINTLTEEKERLAAQIVELEAQNEDLQQSRDCIRRDLAANNAQYLQIMKMDSQLQTQAAADQKKWASEREELERQVRALESVIGRGDGGVGDKELQANMPAKEGSATPSGGGGGGGTASIAEADSIVALRRRLMTLTSRNQTLEDAMRKMRLENKAIVSAAKTLTDAGASLQRSTDEALGEAAGDV